MSVLNKISGFLEDQRNLIRDFYHLDYWDNHTLMEGFAEAADGATELLHDKLQDSHRFVQASAGAGLSVAKLLGALPIGLIDWTAQVTHEIPKGPGQTIYKVFEVPVKGFYHGGVFVFETAKQWSAGSLNSKDSYAIANEVTGTLGMAALLLFGAKKGVDGGGKFLSGLKAAATDLAVAQVQNGMATAAVASSITLAGGSDLMAGAVMMSVGGKSGEDDSPRLEGADKGTGGSTKGRNKPVKPSTGKDSFSKTGRKVFQTEESGLGAVWDLHYRAEESLRQPKRLRKFTRKLAEVSEDTRNPQSVREYARMALVDLDPRIATPKDVALLEKDFSQTIVGDLNPRVNHRDLTVRISKRANNSGARDAAEAALKRYAENALSTTQGLAKHTPDELVEMFVSTAEREAHHQTGDILALNEAVNVIWDAICAKSPEERNQIAHKLGQHPNRAAREKILDLVARDGTANDVQHLWLIQRELLKNDIRSGSTAMDLTGLAVRRFAKTIPEAKQLLIEEVIPKLLIKGERWLVDYLLKGLD